MTGLSRFRGIFRTDTPVMVSAGWCQEVLADSHSRDFSGDSHAEATPHCPLVQADVSFASQMAMMKNAATGRFAQFR